MTKLELRAREYAMSTETPYAVRYTTTVPDTRYDGYKYFFLYCSTNTVAKAFKNQKELDHFLCAAELLDYLEIKNSVAVIERLLDEAIDLTENVARNGHSYYYYYDGNKEGAINLDENKLTYRTIITDADTLKKLF